MHKGSGTAALPGKLAASFVPGLSRRKDGPLHPSFRFFVLNGLASAGASDASEIGRTRGDQAATGEATGSGSVALSARLRE